VIDVSSLKNVDLTVVGEGPYRVEPEGYAFEVAVDEEVGYQAPEHFVIGCHELEVATAIAAFMNAWYRQNRGDHG
jgi:hypothetical protein